MKKGFTLIELLVVIGIMGLLGTASVGGYRQMRRGMEEKGVLQDATYFIRAAYQRAQIDRQPTAVVFWNETLRGDSDNADESAIVVGRAVAVRRSGRISRLDDNVLYDEFSDLSLSFPPDGSSGGSSKSTMYLYPMDRLQDMDSSSTILRSLVETASSLYSDGDRLIALTGDRMTVTEQMSGDADSGERSGYLYYYGFKIRDKNSVEWKAGMAYGFEFAHMELPHGYIFGNSYSSTSGNPVTPAGTLVFDVAANSGNGIADGSSAGIIGRKKVPIYALRPDPSGNLSAAKIGETTDPTVRTK